MLVEATLELPDDQRQIASRRLRDLSEKAFGIDVALYSDFTPKIVRNSDGSWPEWKEDSFNVVDYLGKLEDIPAGVVEAVETGWKIPLMSAGGMAEAGKADAESSKAKPAEAPKVEEKTNFHLVLKTVPPEAKIKLIKEVKGLLNIGLKEAKDQVESVAKQPLVLFKNLPKADAEAKLKKLTDAGGVAELE